MIEYKDKVEIFDKNRVVIAQGDEKISLTQLWEVIVRTKRLPDGFDVSLLYAGVRDRLHDPEREVRQHALRVLIDLIPVTQQPALDNHMHPLLPDLLSNLGHTAPALRKSALDTLRIYLNHSRNSDQLLRDLIPATEVEEHLLAATPSLISPSTGDDTLGYILERLWDEIGEPGYKREVAAKALARIRCVLEDDRFRMLLGSERYAQLQKLCDSYGLPIQCYEGVSDTVLTQEEEEEDKVILETEITLRTGPAITMKIHEESRSGSEDGASQDMGVIKVLEDDFDSDLDDYEEARRTPRKVRFGGESVKMRTPESDSNQEDGVSTIRITLTDAVTIKTRKSLIPIRITSLPSTPKKRSPLVKPRLNQSTPNLSNAKSRSRIPLKKAVKFQATTDETFTAEPSSRQESNQSDTKKIPTRTTKKTKSRAGYLLSPTPIHNEIEVLHNLTRSPECGKTRRSPTPQAEVKEEVFQNLGQALVPYKASEACPKAQRGTERNSSEASVPYNSFQVCPDAQEPVKDAPSDALVPYKAPQTGPKAQRGTMEDSSQALIPNKISQTGPKAQKAAGDFYNSFQVCPDAQEPAKDAPSDALVPYKASQTGPKAQRGTMEDSSQALVPNKISQAGPKAQKAAGDFYNSFQVCPDAEQQGKNAPGGVMVPYNSFQVCPSSEESKPESSKASTTMQIESKEEEGTKTAYNSFKVFPNSRDASKENLSEMKDEDVVEEKPMNLHQPLEISSFSTEDELWNKSEALDNLIKMLKQPNTCESLEAGPAALLFEALFAYQHLDKLHFLADDALALLVKGLRQSVLEDCLGRVAVGLCKVGAPPGVGLALMIMKKCPAKKLQEEIMNKCFAHRTREGALQILMAAARLLPRGELEVEKMTEFAVAALRDRRRKVRHAALETLATLAQLSSNSDVLGTVNRIAEASQDRQYLLRVVRTRLSRRQLPSVEMDGTIRYSTPRDQAEVEWLTGVTVPTSPPSSSASSGTSVNYWKHNLRHEEDKSMSLPLQETQDDSGNGNQQIWAVDSSVFPKNSIAKDAKSTGIKLQPIYILQPEAVRLGERGHRRYDRGRSFSPPKAVKGPLPIVATQATAGSALNNANFQAQRHPKFPDGFRKSFSSEQLYCPDRPQHHEPYSFSLSSRSSTTSTGSSTRSGIWQRDMRSGIPVAISSETKLRIRTSTASSSNVNVGPVIARSCCPCVFRTGKVVDISVAASKQSTPVVVAVTMPPEAEFKSAISSPVHTNDRLSPRENGSAIHQPHPSPSSGSESSGYFTPPPETQQAFVKLDTEDHVSESGNDNNNNSQDCTDNPTQGNFSPSFLDASEAKEQGLNNNPEREERRLLRFSSSSLKEPSFTGKLPPSTEDRRKSKSVVDLQSFLPDITVKRKTVNSAPPLNDDSPSSNNNNIEDLPISPAKTMLPSSESLQKLESPSEEVCERKLTKRFARTLSRKSIKSTPRSLRDTTPRSSRPSSKPKELLQLALAQLNSNEWEVMVQGLQALGKLTRQHPDAIESQIHTVCVTLARQIKNLRSQVARTACHTASELFLNCKRGLDIELEEIAGPLLQRTADTNKFLRADANAALDVMCVQLPTNRVITVVTARGCTHPNCVVRSTSIRLINDMVKRFGADRIFQMQKDIRDKILVAGANALTDGSLDARSYGKAMFSYLIGHQQFQKSLLDAVSQSTLRHIAKTLSSIKPQVT